MAHETQINFVYGEKTADIYTTRERAAESIRRRLNRRSADYEETYRDHAGGSWQFTVSKEDVRSAKGIIKA